MIKRAYIKCVFRSLLLPCAAAAALLPWGESGARAADDTIGAIHGTSPPPPPARKSFVKHHPRHAVRPARKAQSGPPHARRRVAAARSPRRIRSAQHAQPLLASLTVSPDTPGTFHTITAAMARAGVGARISVRPGVYGENIVLRKSVTIVGDGPRESIILRNSHGPCLQMVTDKATVSGITIQALQPTERQDFPAVDIRYGQLELIDCDIKSLSLSCIAIHSQFADPIIQRCVIHDGHANGVYVYDGGKGTIEDCDFVNNMPAGVTIGPNGNPTVRRCTIHKGQRNGVFVFSTGQGSFENCEITENGAAQVDLIGSANPLFTRCKIRNGSERGVVTEDEATGKFVECEITGNSGGDIQTAARTNPVFERCILTAKK